MLGNKIIKQHEYNIRLLSGDDEIDVQDLCERCSDFFELTEGRPPEKDAGKSILSDLPPGKTMKDKFVFGVYKKNVLIAVIDMVKDYKAAGEWMIGLLMLDPRERGNSLGRKLHDSIKDWVLEEHGRALRIGVLEDNHIGYQFWCKMGYIEVDRVKKTYGTKEHTVKVMNLFLK